MQVEREPYCEGCGRDTDDLTHGLCDACYVLLDEEEMEEYAAFRDTFHRVTLVQRETLDAMFGVEPRVVH